MVRSRGNNQRGGRRRRRRNNIYNRRGNTTLINIPQNATTYNGPSLVPGASQQKDHITVTLTSVEALTSSAGLVINAVYNDNPSGYVDWSDFAAIYEQYRVLSFRADYMPHNRYNWGTSSVRVLACVVDRQDATALTSYANAVQFASCQFKSNQDPWTRVIKMCGVEEADWKNTAATVAEHYLKTYSTGNAASTEFGLVRITLVVQFRGRN